MLKFKSDIAKMQFNKFPLAISQIYTYIFGKPQFLKNF